MLTSRVSPACNILRKIAASGTVPWAVAVLAIILGGASTAAAQNSYPPLSNAAPAPALPPQLWPAPEVFSLIEEPRNSAPNAWQSNVTPPPASSSYPQLAMSQLPPSPPPVFPSSQGASNNSSAAGSTETQTAPGAPDYQSRNVRLAPALPSYYYQRSYYETYGIGARPLADYAPFGYERAAAKNKTRPAIRYSLQLARRPSPLRRRRAILSSQE